MMLKNLQKPVSNFLLFLLLIGASKTQAQQDSLQYMSYANFMQLVTNYHPLMKQAKLLVSAADAYQLSVKGNFDPKLFYEFRSKIYDQKNYYQLANGGVGYASPYAFELKTGFEQNSGKFMNPENTVPSSGLGYAQISLPVLQGLVIDDRRAALKYAKAFQKLNKNEQLNAINELLYKAGKAYWDWQLAYNNLTIYNKSVQLAVDRLDAVRTNAVLGDRPYIDTVEATIQWQDRLLNYQQGLMDYRSKTWQLSSLLWLENDVPIVLTDKVVPADQQPSAAEIIDIKDKLKNIDSLIYSHPQLKIYESKLDQLRVDRSLKKEKLKPVLNVNYNYLFNPSASNVMLLNNYKWGVTVGLPTFFRKERGEFQMTKIKIQQTSYESISKRTELLNKFKAAVNEWERYIAQLNIYRQNVKNYEQLWLSEKRLFDAGESSLFLTNQREIGLINAQIKLNELENKNRKAVLDIYYSFGQIQ